MEPNNSSTRLGGCSFELEICYIPSIGITQNCSEAVTPSKSILKNGTVNGKSNSDGIANMVRSACVGIRRKRLKGDSWCYRNVCEQILALTAVELKRPAESSV